MKVYQRTNCSCSLKRPANKPLLFVSSPRDTWPHIPWEMHDLWMECCSNLPFEWVFQPAEKVEDGVSMNISTPFCFDQKYRHHC